MPGKVGVDWYLDLLADSDLREEAALALSKLVRPALELLHNGDLDEQAQETVASVHDVASWQALLEDLRRELLPLITAPELTPVQRAEAGRALSLTGDPRPGVGLLPDGLPDIDWVDIPEGPFLMGFSEEKDPRGYADGDDPLHTIVLPFYRFARYPVTYAQYHAFISDGGYEEDAWWEGLALRVREPDPGRFPFANHPRERVNWYGAMAYCRWLSARLGYEVRLPTEEEWVKAARGTDDRTFPWGDEFSVDCANTEESGIGQTSAVGIFPEGASPYGVLDMGGNVSKWCISYSYTEYSPGREFDREYAMGGDVPRAVRSGAWNSSRFYAEVTFNYHYRAASRFDSVGFRLVAPA